MLRNILNRNVPPGMLFNGHYVDARVMYVWRFRQIPCVAFVGELDLGRVFTHLDSVLRNDIVGIYQHSFLNHADGHMFFNNTLFVLRGKRIVELAENYCHVLHTVHQYQWAHQLAAELGTSFRLAPAEENRSVIGFVRNTEMN